MLYRRVQVLAILSNQCCQMYIWPAINFFGGLLAILLLYSLLILKTRIPVLGFICIGFLAVAIMVVCCGMLDLGSRPILICRKILRKTKQVKSRKWSQKFFRSCPVIMLRIGEFHTMDRSRISAFIRFILQRTFLLVVRTKVSVGFGKDIVIFMPTSSRNF